MFVVLLLILCMYDAVHSLKFPPANRAAVSSSASEFESMKNVEVIGANSGKVLKMGELWNTKGSVFTSEDRAIVILFRSFG